MAETTEERKRRDPILSQIESLDEAGLKKVIKTRARRTKIRKEYVGQTIGVFNGRDYTNVHIREDMIGRTLAKVAPRSHPTAQAKYIHVSPRKMRQVADLVKNRAVEDALGVLNFTPKKAALVLAKVLKSAVANKLSVEGTSHLNPEDLRISRIVIDGAPTAKRIRFRSMGRVYRVRKRYCHLGVYLSVVSGAPTVEEARASRTGAKAKAAKSTATGAKKKTAAAKGKKKTTKAAAAKKTTKAPAKKKETKAPSGKGTAAKKGPKATSAKKTTTKKTSSTRKSG